MVSHSIGMSLPISLCLHQSVADDTIAFTVMHEAGILAATSWMVAAAINGSTSGPSVIHRWAAPAERHENIGRHGATRCRSRSTGRGTQKVQHPTKADRWGSKFARTPSDGVRLAPGPDQVLEQLRQIALAA